MKNTNEDSASPAETRVGEMKMELEIDVPRPSASFRRRAWAAFQRALDPLAPLKPPPRPRG